MSSVFDDIFGDPKMWAVEHLRDAMKQKAQQHDSILSGFKHGIRCAAKLVRESGQSELADRIEKLKLVRKGKTDDKD